MKLFGNRKRDKTLAAYARQLPARLARDYGASAFYTTGQINKAIASLKLDPAFAAYAHAMFLPEADYNIVSPTYAEARVAFASHAPGKPVTGQFYESGLGMTGVDGAGQ